MGRFKENARRVASNDKVLRVADRAIASGLLVAAPPYKAFARIGAGRLPSSTTALKRLGIFPIRDHYYQPLFNDAHLKISLSTPRELPGIDWRLDDQLKFVDTLEFRDELLALGWDRDDSGANGRFVVRNGSFGGGDADALYSVVRYLKPRRVFEIGSGHSTRVVRAALDINVQEGAPCKHVCIEPYESPWLAELGGVDVVRKPVENLGVEFFSELEANDLLFIDSSHIIRPQGDVLFEYLHLLPKLSTGVVIHVHDIFSPRDYPDSWVRDKVLMWNEQYLLEALLSDSKRYEVVMALNLLKNDHYEAVAPKLPYLRASDEPGSFYLRVRD